jgi:hypothetical protein
MAEQAGVQAGMRVAAPLLGRQAAQRLGLEKKTVPRSSA